MAFWRVFCFLPRAETLQNESDYKKAVERYGEKEIAAVTELAVYELIRNHGWSSFVTYLQETAKKCELENLGNLNENWQSSVLR